MVEMVETKVWRWLVILFSGLIVIFVIVFNYYDDRVSSKEPVDFQSCLEAGNPIMESYPRRCNSGSRTFTEDLGTTLDKDQLIRVIEPKPNSVISSPVTIVGMARGVWFFEGSFPIRLEMGSGTVVAVGVAKALGEWMTEEFVPFEGLLTFSTQATGSATLIFKKDNPSGLSEKDDRLSFPVILSKSNQNSVSAPVGVPVGGVFGGCRVSGCSGQICTEEEMMSTCEYNPVYACYKNSGVRCERQANGRCGWTETASLKACLAGTE